ITLILLLSLAVSFKASAACSLYSQLLQRMDEQFSGEITENQAFSSIKNLSPTPIPKAPPDAPSPITIQITGTFNLDISRIFLAMASPCPRSSASKPGYAPGVSIKVITGMPNFSADFIKRRAFLYPSGFAIPKFLYCLVLCYNLFVAQ